MLEFENSMNSKREYDKYVLKKRKGEGWSKYESGASNDVYEIRRGAIGDMTSQKTSSLRDSRLSHIMKANSLVDVEDFRKSWPYGSWDFCIWRPYSEYSDKGFP